SRASPVASRPPADRRVPALDLSCRIGKGAPLVRGRIGADGIRADRQKDNQHRGVDPFPGAEGSPDDGDPERADNGGTLVSMAKPIPDNYPNLFPYIVVDAAASAIDFYTTVFGAREIVRIPTPDGRVAHSELQIGDSMLMLADESPEVGSSPRK